MNRDTLYSVGVVDTEGGAVVRVPPMPDHRYASVYLADNDHYVPEVIYDAGEHRLPQDTRYLAVGVRIQIFDPHDEDELQLVNRLQYQFTIEASSAEPFGPPDWDQDSLNALRAQYEAEFSRYDRYPDGWQRRRGEVDESTRHLAAAGAWGLFPNRDAVYINHNPGMPETGCYQATYSVPENDAFWSITVYGDDGFMKSDDNILNAANVVLDDDGRFTARFGSRDACGDGPNRLDTTAGWNFLMRVYRPGPSVFDGSYTCPTSDRPPDPRWARSSRTCCPSPPASRPVPCPADLAADPQRRGHDAPAPRPGCQPTRQGHRLDHRAVTAVDSWFPAPPPVGRPRPRYRRSSTSSSRSPMSTPRSTFTLASSA